MALSRSRQSARRVKDRWKSKQTYKLVAPTAFSNKILGDTLSDEPDKLLGRRIETSLFDLTGDMRSMHVKLYFQVNETVDFNAKCIFDGHAHTSDYVRRLTRRGTTKVDAVFDLRTNDGSRIRVKPFVITDRRCTAAAATQIRQIMFTHLSESAKAHTLHGFLADVLIGDLSQRIQKDAKKVHPVRRVEIAKTEMLRAPSIETDETPLFVLAQDDDEDDDSEE